ncbi:MAG: hypothetical protein AAF597_17145 [Bacteroidota bacterium]
MSSYIIERDMLKVMETGRVFSMRVVTYDRRRSTGGKVKYYPEAILVQPQKEAASNANRPLTPAEMKAIEFWNETKGGHKDPHHKQFYTRNIRMMQNGHPTGEQKKIHPPLVLEFNGKRVLP